MYILDLTDKNVTYIKMERDKNKIRQWLTRSNQYFIHDTQLINDHTFRYVRNVDTVDYLDIKLSEIKVTNQKIANLK